MGSSGEKAVSRSDLAKTNRRTRRPKGLCGFVTHLGMADRRPGAAVALGCLVVLLGAASDRVGLSDFEIQTLVEVSLRDKKIAGVRISVKDGVVTLAGMVPSAWARARATELARKPEDVRSLVVDDLKVARGESDGRAGEEEAEKIGGWDRQSSTNHGNPSAKARVDRPPR